MQGMFFADKKLKKLNLSNFDTSNVTKMYQMFRECNALEELNMS
jgi:surface protein